MLRFGVAKCDLDRLVSQQPRLRVQDTSRREREEDSATRARDTVLVVSIFSDAELGILAVVTTRRKFP